MSSAAAGFAASQFLQRKVRKPADGGGLHGTGRHGAANLHSRGLIGAKDSDG